MIVCVIYMEVYLVWFLSFLLAMLWSLYFFLLILGHPRKRFVTFFLQWIIAWKDIVVNELILTFFAFLLCGLYWLFFFESELELHVVINVNLIVTNWNAIGQEALSDRTLWAFELGAFFFLIVLFSLLVVWCFGKVWLFIVVLYFFDTLADLAFFFLISFQFIGLWVLR